jgi:hypothetical protein
MSSRSTASEPMGAGAISLDVKRPGREADYSSLSSTEVKNGGALLPLCYVCLWRGT